MQLPGAPGKRWLASVGHLIKQVPAWGKAWEPTHLLLSALTSAHQEESGGLQATMRLSSSAFWAQESLVAQEGTG